MKEMHFVITDNFDIHIIAREFRSSLILLDASNFSFSGRPKFRYHLKRSWSSCGLEQSRLRHALSWLEVFAFNALDIAYPLYIT